MRPLKLTTTWWLATFNLLSIIRRSPPYQIPKTKSLGLHHFSQLLTQIVDVLCVY
jgi:hypothetical protein